MARLRARDLGLVRSELPSGADNAITDVAGVRMGHTILISGEGPLRPGQGPVRTGVTVILAHEDNLFRQKVRAAVHTINGFGMVCGFEPIREVRLIETPIALTNTLNVGLVADALIEYAIQQSPEIGTRTGHVNVVVGETNDGYLNDLQGRHVRAEHVFAAIESASPGPVQEGNVGAGTGTHCFGWKGGIGTASRVLPPKLGGFTPGALMQTNFGSPRDLMIAGIPVGLHIQPPGAGMNLAENRGSVMVVLATDAVLTARQLWRLCVRAAAGLARTGSHYGHGSGDFVIAFSTPHRIEHQPAMLTAERTMLADEPKVMDGLFRAVTESAEEAVLNALCRAETLVGRDGNTRHALPAEEAAALVRNYLSPG